MYKLSEIKFLCERAGKSACVRAWAGDEKWARIFAKEAVTWYWVLAEVAGPDVMEAVSGHVVVKLVEQVRKDGLGRDPGTNKADFGGEE